MTPDEAHTFLMKSIDKAYSNLIRESNKPKGIKFIKTPDNDFMVGFTIDYDKSMITSIQLRGSIKQVTIKGALSYEDI